MKKNSKSTIIDYESFDYNTYKYHGVFLSSKTVRKIDPKRFRKKHKDSISTEMFEYMSRRNTKYYFPPKKYRYDYMINIIKDNLNELRTYWNLEYKDLLENIDAPEERYNNCIDDPISTPMMNQREREQYCKLLLVEREQEHPILINSFLAQNVLYIAGMLEVILQQTLSEREIFRDKFNRKELYRIYKKRTQTGCETMSNFKKHDRFMALYKYIKHSSEENYSYLLNTYPELLNTDIEYEDELAGSYLVSLKVDKETLNGLIDDLTIFFDEYIEKAFDESSWHASWNYGEFFKSIADDSFWYGDFFGTNY